MGKRKGTAFFYTLLGLQVGLLVLLIARVSLSGLTPADRPEVKTAAIRGTHIGRIEKPSPSSPAGSWTNDPEIFKALQDKARALENQKQQVELKEKDLGRIQLEIDGKINQLNQLQVQLRKIVEQSKTVQDKKTLHLAEIFCAMPPDKAARMIEKMDDRTVTEVFQNMRSKEVGGILTQLEPSRAARISAALSLLSPRVN
jgi:flagellar motility protein MotE (MotC chaperone)